MVAAGFALMLEGGSLTPVAADYESAAEIAALEAAPAPQLSEAQKIERLIGFVHNLKDAVFIRNGEEYSAEQAAQHMQLKLKNAGSRVQTADEFIERCASRSFLSGKDYQIRLAGRTRPSAEVLREELRKIETGEG